MVAATLVLIVPACGDDVQSGPPVGRDVVPTPDLTDPPVTGDAAGDTVTPGDSAPADSAPADSTPGDTSDTAPGDTTPADADASDTAPGDTAPADTCPPGGCAACDPACTDGFVCGDGACVCPPGLAECTGACVDLDRDPANCHACGKAARPELCNNVDDDCNGLTDDALTAPTTPCETTNEWGTCGGQWACTPPTWTCDAPTPAPEQCDGLDNDCNGATDEGFKNAVTGQYDRDVACGDCATNCIASLTVDNGYGRCDSSGDAPQCALVCCTIDDPNPACDGYDYLNTNTTVDDGCEDRQVTSCTGSSGCPDGQFCDDGSCAPNVAGGPCQEDTDCAGGDVCVGGICGCAGDEFTAEGVPPNVLIVLDRSGSMTSSPPGTSDSKWEIALASVSTLTGGYDALIRFGLMLYPGTNQAGNEGGRCKEGAVFINPALSTGSAIDTFLEDAGNTAFNTPTAESLEWLVDYAGLKDPSRQNFIVLITDGQSNCDDPTPQVTALRNQTPPILTYVIGFGGGVDPDELNDMAVAGGTALSGDTKYYQADDALSLGAALNEIAGNVLSCTYQLGQLPPDDAGLMAFFDGAQQTRDMTQSNGWDYDPGQNQVTFYGEPCGALLDGNVDDLVLVYECPNPIIIGN